MPGIGLYEYLAYNKDPQVSLAARKVITDAGYRFHGQDRLSLLNGLRAFVTHDGHDGLAALAMIHPDRELILGTDASGSHSFDGFSQSANSTAALAGLSAVESAKPIVAAAETHKDHTALIVSAFFFTTLIAVTLLSKK